MTDCIAEGIERESECLFKDLILEEALIRPAKLFFWGSRVASCVADERIGPAQLKHRARLSMGVRGFDADPVEVRIA